MNFLLPVLAAILQASSRTLDKIVLSFRNVGYKTYIGVSFPMIFAITLIIFAIVRPPITVDLFQGHLLFLLILSIGLILLTNILFYRALDHDELGEMETLGLFRGLSIVLFASFIFTDERNPYILIPAVIAGTAVLWSHWEHHKFHLAKNTKWFVIESIFAAPISAATAKILLTAWNPIALEFVRAGTLAILFSPYFFRTSGKLSSKTLYTFIAINVLTTFGWIFFFFSFQSSGIVYTLLIFSIRPLLVYMASLIFLKEKFHPKKAIAFAIVLVCIIGAQILTSGMPT